MIQRTGWEGTALDHEGPIAYAHRGGNRVAPENTMEAFANAVDQGYAFLETDVHALADGQLAAWHDDSLGDGTPIASLTLKDLRAAQQDGYDVPILGELLDAFPANRWSIDAKNDAAVTPYLETLKKHNTFGRVILASFSEASVERLRAGAPENTPSAMSEEEVGKFWFACMGAAGDGSDGPWLGNIASVPVTTEFGGEIIEVVNEQFIEGAHARGVEVHVWTVNDQREMERLLDLGVDGIYSDDTALLKSVFESRGHAIGFTPQKSSDPIAEQSAPPRFTLPTNLRWVERHL